MQSRKLSIHGTRQAQTSQYSNIATSNTLKLIFSFIHSSLVVICWFTWMSWSRCSSFCGVTAVCGCPEHGLSFTSLLPMQKCTTLCLTVLTSTGWSQVPMNVSKCNFVHMEQFSDTSLLHMHFHIRHHFFRLPLCCHLSYSNKVQQNIGGKVQSLLPYHQHPSLMWANIMQSEALPSERPS